MPIAIDMKIHRSNLLIFTFLRFVKHLLDPFHCTIKFLQPKHSWLQKEWQWNLKKQITQRLLKFTMGFQVESGNTEARKRKMNTKAFEDNGMAVTEMVNLLRAKVIQWRRLKPWTHFFFGYFAFNIMTKFTNSLCYLVF